MSVPRKGENFELRADLNSEYREKRADAIKRVIANMTVGKDVSGLFPDVLKNMQTEDLEQKKLVYLYLMNYAKEQPELVILAVNTFVKDTADSNPLVRALAIRTMSCLRAEKILSYLSEPLHRCLRDENPYVRKTAALAVAKLWDLKPSLALEGGFVEVLREMVGDGNPMVVANAVTALSDIQEAYTQSLAAPRSPRVARSDDGEGEPTSDDEDLDSPAALTNGAKEIFIIDPPTLSKLLVALNECSEWGRIALLSALARYKTRDVDEAEHICERVMPQFQHANGGVLLGAVRVVMTHMKVVEREDLLKTLVKKMAPPLVTLISSAPEIQWVALRNISLLLQTHPDLLSSEMRVFFCKYNDPPYVKVEKLEIMVRLANEANVGTLLSELKEYASEIDVDMVRKSVKAIGQVAIKIADAADRCVAVLLELIGTRISYVVQEAVVVMKDIFRKYPHSYEGVIPTLCSNLEELEEPEAKASLIWIVGEYADKIENADELLGSFLRTFKDESYAVQLQTLTAIVKLFLKKPDESQAIVQQVLQTATRDCDSPDVRDRAYVYWRLLSSDPAAAKAVVLADRPPIDLPKTTVPPAVLDELLAEISTLASVYHRPAETFVGRGRVGIDDLQRRAQELAEGGGGGPESARDKALHVVEQGQKSENLLDFDDDPEPATSIDGSSSLALAGGISTLSPMPTGTNAAALARNPLDDMMDLFNQSALAAPVTGTATVGAASSPFDGLGGGFGTSAASSQPQKPPPPPPQQQQQAQSDDLLGLF